MYRLVSFLSYSEPLYLRNVISASCYLSPRWGFGECVFSVSIHLPPRWGYLSLFNKAFNIPFRCSERLITSILALNQWISISSNSD